MKLIENIKTLSAAYYHDVVAIRRHLHMHPELSLMERQTADYIAMELHAMGIPFTEGVAGTGLVALIEGRPDSDHVIALRADMDALPIAEENDVPYKSLNAGVMHACGHDAHMASLLGAARILNKLRDEWSGTIKLIFQPSEEKCPGGAHLMIKEGVLENPVVSKVFGQHVFPGLPAGKVGIRSGKYMASADEIYLTVKGRGGHAAMPHMAVDPIVIGAHIITSLQTIVSRSAKPVMPSVLTFGRFSGQGRTNIIPDEVHIEGTFRTFDEEWRAEALNRIRDMATGMAAAMGGSCEVFFEKGYPFLVNDAGLAASFKKYAQDFLGEENVVDLDLAMTAEDFAYFSHQRPSCFYRFGINNAEKGLMSNLHTPTFDIDETALITGMGLMAYVAISSLGNNHQT